MTDNSFEEDSSTFELLSQGMKLQFTDFDGEEINIEIDEIGPEDNDNDNTETENDNENLNDNTDTSITTIVNVNDFDYSNSDIKDEPEEMNDSEYEMLQDSVEIIVHTSETSGQTKSVMFICKKCSRPCHNLLSLQQHAKQCHVVSMLSLGNKATKKSIQECGYCRQIFVGNSKAPYLQHMSKCQGSNRVAKVLDSKAKKRKQCSKCSATFDKDSELMNHLKICRGGRKDLSVFGQTKNKSGKTNLMNYLCICTWCDFKANRYSDVKRHIESQHELKSHFPCKECSFVCKTVEDYAKHFNCFHKTDEYKHACTTCSFRCNNRLDLKAHYLCAHKKQRTYSCKLCGCRSQDMVTMKKHVVRIHSNPIFHCKACDFKCNMKNDYRKHLSTVHNGASGFEGECPDIQFEITDIVDVDVKEEDERIKEAQPVPETHILEEQIFDDHILDNNISPDRDSTLGLVRVEPVSNRTDGYKIYQENNQFINIQPSPQPGEVIPPQPGVFIFKRNNIFPMTTLSSDRSLD